MAGATDARLQGLPENPEPLGDTPMESRRWAHRTCMSPHALFLAFWSHEVPVDDEQFTAAVRFPSASSGRFTTPLKSGLEPQV